MLVRFKFKCNVWNECVDGYNFTAYGDYRANSEQDGLCLHATDERFKASTRTHKWEFYYLLHLLQVS